MAIGGTKRKVSARATTQLTLECQPISVADIDRIARHQNMQPELSGLSTR